ncbi:MAG: carboxypeptidase-like regulatory domain-containing protein [Gemmatimonadaceae bacterium]
MAGIVVVGEQKSAVGKTPVVLLDGRENVVDTSSTDVFGGFTLTAEKPGKYSVLVRREGYYPVSTERFELLEDETRNDTIFLLGPQAETSVREIIAEEMRRIFGSSVQSALHRYLGPDDIEKLRPHAFSLGDLVRSGRLAGLSWANQPSGCLRFSATYGCAQIFLDGIPVNMRPDQVSASDVEAIVALRDTELGIMATTRGALDNSQYGAVAVFTRRFRVR